MTLFPVPAERDNDEVLRIELANEDYEAYVLGDEEEQWLCFSLPIQAVADTFEAWLDRQADKSLPPNATQLYLYGRVKP